MFKLVVPALAVCSSAFLFAQAVPHEQVRIISAEFGVERNTVKGAPYSAQANTVTTQTLADGNRIVRRSTAVIARDSEGRTRREQTLQAVGPWASAADVPAMVIVNDPVAQTSYVLDPKSRIARKSAMAIPSAEHLAKLRDEAHASGPMMVTLMPEAGHAAKLQDEAHAVITGIELHRQAGSQNVVNDSLGTKSIEGIQAEGKRVTRTVPAGEAGNDRPLVYINEVWTAPELQVIVMSRHVDPLDGETVYTLTNLQRTEPDAALFRVPADYTVKESRK